MDGGEFQVEGGEKMIDIALDLIKKGGGDGLVYHLKEWNKVVSSTMEGPERIFERFRDGMGILIIKNMKKAFVNISDPTESKVKEAVSQALEMVDFTEPDDGNVVSDEVNYEPLDGLYDPELDGINLGKLKEISLDMVDVAKNYDPRIKFIRGAGVELSKLEITVATTKGVMKETKKNYVSAFIMCSAIDQSGGSMGFKSAVAKNLDSLNPKKLAEEAADEAVRGLGGVVEKTGVYDVVFDPDVVSMFFTYAFSPFSGERVYKRSSFLNVDNIGKKLFSEKVSIINDARNTDFIGAVPFDSEGTNTKKFYVVENGVLKSFLHNLYSAKKLNMEPTGNAFSRSYKSLPGITPVAVRFESNAKRDELISSVENGIYINQMMGVHTLDPVSGRFSVQISGYMIEGGKFTKPVRGMALSGYLKDLLNNVELVADDYKDHVTFVGSTILIKGMSVSGK